LPIVAGIVAVPNVKARAESWTKLAEWCRRNHVPLRRCARGRVCHRPPSGSSVCCEVVPVMVEAVEATG
jgi:hypothetical protein